MIRRAEPRDAVALAAMLRDLNDEPGLRPDLITPAGVARDLIGDPRTTAVIAEADGIPAGFATAHPTYDSSESRWGLFLNDLYVAPQARRRGLARALIAAIAAEARQQGCTCVWWNADAGDALALAFHRSLGVGEAAIVDFLLTDGAFHRFADAAKPA